MNIKTLLAVSIGLSTLYSHTSLAAIASTNLELQNGTCDSGYRQVTADEARSMLSSLNTRMGKWQITNLANNYVITGSGYGNQIKKDGPARYSWCAPKGNSLPEVLAYPAIMLSEGNENNVEWELVNKQNDFYAPWSQLAAMFGFAWVGGDRDTLNGHDMSVSRTGDHKYRIVGHSNPSCDGYRCAEKTTLDFDNFTYIIDPDSLVASNRIQSSQKTIGVKRDVATNHSNTEQQYRVTFTYSQATNWNKTDTYGYSEKVTSKSKVKFPLFGESELSLEIGATQTYATANGGNSSVSITNTAVINVPPHSKIPVTMEIFSSDLDYDYTFNADVAYDITMTGFMKTTENGLKSHRSDRPTISKKYTVGRGSPPLTNLKYQYSYPDSPVTGEYWDWNRMNRTFDKSYMDFFVSKSLRPIRTKISGQFHATSAYGSELVIEPTQTLSTRSKRSIQLQQSLTDNDLEQLGITDFKISIIPIDVINN